MIRLAVQTLRILESGDLIRSASFSLLVVRLCTEFETSRTNYGEL